MVGSRNGGKEVAYVGTPARAEDVRAGMEIVDIGGVPVAIVPGLVHHGKSGVDVMRGEETILFGCAPGTGAVVLPGTHSKWARVDDGRVTEFCTFATGELFDSLLHSGSLRDLLQAEAGHDANAFRDGVHRGLEAGGILHDYFAVRAEVVTGGASAEGIPSRLSGLLIGHEIAEALGRSLVAPGEPIAIVGDGELADRYGDAVGIAGLTATILPAVPCLARGWLLLANDLPRTEP
jgi:2-dehydro-3-deoxygalactonokinase